MSKKRDRNAHSFLFFVRPEPGPGPAELSIRRVISRSGTEYMPQVFIFLVFSHIAGMKHGDMPTDDVVGRDFARLCLLAESQEDDRPRRVNTYPLSPVTGNTCFLTESQDDTWPQALPAACFSTESQNDFYSAVV